MLAFPARTLLACLESDSLFAVDWIRQLSRQRMRSRAREERLTLRSPRERPALPAPRARRRGAVQAAWHTHAMGGHAHETLYRTLVNLEREGLIVRDGI